MNSLSFYALVAGIAITLQAAMNSQLGVLLKNSNIATSIAFFVSCMFSLTVMALTIERYPQLADIKSVPMYLWFSGGALSAFAVGMFYYLVPKMGVGTMMSYALSGQIIMAIIASHFGWFGLPIKPLTSMKLIGALSLITGVILLNCEQS